MKEIAKKEIIETLKPFFHAPSMVAVAFGLYLLRLTDHIPSGIDNLIILLGVSIWCLVSIMWWSLTTKLNLIEKSIQQRN